MTELEQIAETNVLAVRGSYDAPGFGACVKSETDFLRLNKIAEQMERALDNISATHTLWCVGALKESTESALTRMALIATEALDAYREWKEIQ